MALQVYQPKVLGISTPSNTNNTQLYSPPADKNAILDEITICNTSASAITFRIFIDDAGAGFSTSTAVYYDAAIAAHTTITWTPANGEGIALTNGSAQIGCRSSSASNITFMAFGREKE